MDVRHHVHARPDILPHKSGDTVGNARESRGGAGAVHEGPVQVDPVVGVARPAAHVKGRGVEHGNEDQPPLDGCQLDLLKQSLDRHRSFVFVAVIGTRGKKSVAFAHVWSDHDRQGDEMVRPERIVFEGDPVVPAPR